MSATMALVMMQILLVVANGVPFAHERPLRSLANTIELVGIEVKGKQAVFVSNVLTEFVGERALCIGERLILSNH